MCGFAGIFGSNVAGVDWQAQVERMCMALAHRGPDGEGFYRDRHVCLGHRRLSIIDVAQGQQPMTTPDGRFTVVFNGEIYNYEELGERLRKLGHKFETQSDTEVLLHTWIEYGEACPKHLRGMFAFAIWDSREQSLFLSRDRIGIKPLYWARVREGLVFGSEIKALLHSDGIERALDPQALDDYFAYGFVRAPRSMYRGVKSLLPGHSLTLRMGRGNVECLERRYWQIPVSGLTREIAFDEAVRELQGYIDAAVTSHLVSEVPLGALLSGGIDSSTVVWCMARAQSRPVETFSIGFDEPEFDETSVARCVAQHFGTHHHEERVTPDAVAVLPELVRHFDEPFGDPSAIPTWYVCHMARRHVTVCLTGDGGDELFGGYTRYRTVGREWQRRRACSNRLLAVLGRLAPAESRVRNRSERLRAEQVGAYYARFRNNFSPEMRASLLSEAFGREIDFDLTQDLQQRVTSPSPVSAVEYAQLADMQGYLCDDVLVKVDRMSMAHSLEARVPFLDHAVLEFAQSLPESFKLQGGRGKAVLRALIEPHMPREVLTHPKRGFSVPLSRWFRRELKGRLAEAVHGATFRDSGMFRPSYVERLFRMHQSGVVDLSFQLWQLLVFDEWWRGQTMNA